MENNKFPSITKRDYSSVDVGDNIFGDRNYVGYIMKVEAALARVQAELGIIPKEAAEEITKKCDINLISAEEFGRQLRLPAIREWSLSSVFTTMFATTTTVSTFTTAQPLRI
ncbi:MAG: hypothetical protein IKL92_00395 [Oscillospiraceae bacterium]|nr:hypothetical protein [Oscillospiraceae bacterium]